MSTSYRQTGTVANCGGVGACSGLGLGATTYPKQVQQGGTPGGAVTLNIAKSSLDKVYIHLQSPSGDPGLSSWPSGNWVIRLNVTTPSGGFASLQAIYICRMDNTCTPVATVASLTSIGQDLSGPSQVYTYTLSGSAQASTGTGDMFYIVLAFRSTAGADSLGVTFDQNIDTPFGVAVAVGPRPRVFRPRRVHPQQFASKPRRHPLNVLHTALQSARVALRRKVATPVNRSIPPNALRDMARRRRIRNTGFIPPTRALVGKHRSSDAWQQSPHPAFMRARAKRGKNRNTALVANKLPQARRSRLRLTPFQLPKRLRARKFFNTALQVVRFPKRSYRGARAGFLPLLWRFRKRRGKVPGTAGTSIPVIQPRLRHVLRRSLADVVSAFLRPPQLAKSRRRRFIRTEVPVFRRTQRAPTHARSLPSFLAAIRRRGGLKHRLPKQEIRVIFRRPTKGRTLGPLSRITRRRLRRLVPTALPVLKRRKSVILRSPPVMVRWVKRRVPGSGQAWKQGTGLLKRRTVFGWRGSVLTAQRVMTRRLIRRTGKSTVIGPPSGTVIPGPYSVSAAQVTPVGGAIAAQIVSE